MDISTILLTGATGFIGSHIRNVLLRDQRYKLITLLRKRAAIDPAADETILHGNFYNALLLNKIETPVDCIIHCAAIRGESALAESEYYRINVAGTQNLLEFAQERNIPRFIYLSSVGVLGTIPRPQPARADQSPHPDGKYHRSKWQAEELVRTFHSDRLQTLILRPTVTYGEGDDGFIPRLIEKIRSRRFVFPKKQIRIHLLHVDALSGLIVRLLESQSFNGKAYIVADRESVTLETVLDVIYREEFGKPFPRYLRLPDFVFGFGKEALHLLGRNTLLTSVRLISESWTYDISETIRDLNYKAVDTMDRLSKVIKGWRVDE